jgi:NHL repeat
MKTIIKTTIGAIATSIIIFSCSNSDDKRQPTPPLPGTIATVTTFAGSGIGYYDATGTDAQMKGPAGIASDADGNIYFSDFDDHKIRKISPAGAVTTLSGSTVGNDDGVTTKYNKPYGITITNNDVYVIDGANNFVKKITTTNGEASFFAGNGVASGDGIGSLLVGTKFNSPLNITTTNNGSIIYVTDSYNHKIKKIENNASTVLAGSTPGNSGGQGVNAKFAYPRGIVVDANGNVFVADSNNNMIKKITPTGLVTVFAGTGAEGSTDGAALTAQFKTPYGLAIDSKGNIFVADTRNNAIRKITPAGIVSTIAGDKTAGTPGDINGDGTIARFFSPTGVCTDAVGNVYVADYGNHKIKKITFN